MVTKKKIKRDKGFLFPLIGGIFGFIVLVIYLASISGNAEPPPSVLVQVVSLGIFLLIPIIFVGAIIGLVIGKFIMRK